MHLRHLLKLTALLAASSALTKFTAMGFVVLLARSATVPEFGTFKYLVTVSFLCALAVTGVATPLTRNISAHADSSAVAGYLGGAVAITVPLFMAVALVVSVVSTHPLLLLLLLYAATVDALYLAYVRGLLSRHKMAGYKLLANVIQLLLLAGWYLAFRSVNLVWAVLFYSLSGTLALVTLECRERAVRLDFAGWFSRARDLVRFSVLTTVANVGATVMFSINTIWVNRYCGKDQLAHYGVAEALAVVFLLLPDAMSAIAMPKAATLKDRVAAGRPLLWLTTATVGASAAAMVPLVLFQDQLVTLAFTQQYLPAARLILPLVMGNVAVGLHSVYAALYYGFNRPRTPTVTITIGCLLHVGASGILTERYGPIGAGWSFAASGAVILVLMMARFHWEYRDGAGLAGA